MTQATLHMATHYQKISAMQYQTARIYRARAAKLSNKISRRAYYTKLYIQKIKHASRTAALARKHMGLL